MIPDLPLPAAWLQRTLLTCVAAVAMSGPSIAADSAVIFMYHHVDRGTPSATSVTPERFEEHLAYLEHGSFTVWPLSAVLEAIRRGEALPERTVVITFDDGYESVLTEALPALARRNWPFTVFVSTDAIDGSYGGFLSWDQIRRIAAAGGEIGNHSSTHAHLVRREAGESESAWHSRVRTDIARAGVRISDEVGAAAIPVLAYPYGEFTNELKEVAAELGLVGLGQHSGAIGYESDLLALPRYPMAIGFDGLDEFALRARSRPLPLRLLLPERHIAAPDEARPELRFELSAEPPYRAAELACYASGQGRMEMEGLDDAGRRFVIAPREALAPGRSKYNCTAPATSESGTYYWYSHLWMTKHPDGSWYSE